MSNPTPKFKVGDRVWTRLVERIPEWKREEHVQVTGILEGINSIRYDVSYIQADGSLRPMNAYLVESDLSASE